MCAICGIVNFNEGDLVSAADISRMSAISSPIAVLTTREPSSKGRAGLGFRRLSIIDLAGGHQPIFNEDRSAAIVFNGEIYNYRDLASQPIWAVARLRRHAPDTSETILHSLGCSHGDNCVDHLRGMFAFAIWDRASKRLLLARDRLGIKPLYYYRNKLLAFCIAEIKSPPEIPGRSARSGL